MDGDELLEEVGAGLHKGGCRHLTLASSGLTSFANHAETS